MPNTFVTADLHLGHEKTCTTFLGHDGRPLRPFASAAEMDEAIVARWNAAVRPSDKVYVLGDVAIRKQALPTLLRLNGKLRLVRGNHDIFPIKEYLKYFDEVYACRVLTGMILTHIPIHPDSIGRYGANVHGHMHHRSLFDPRYLCVSVEQTDYTPIDLDEVRNRLKNQGYSPS